MLVSFFFLLLSYLPIFLSFPFFSPCLLPVCIRWQLHGAVGAKKGKVDYGEIRGGLKCQEKEFDL